jgi:ribosomal protein S18 acetylase RimI-like enzyme
MNTKYTLRTAEQNDAKLLFDIKVKAMKEIVNEDDYQKYLAKFEPEKVQVIQFEGKDIGRLRVVRSPESIYIGGIQILPEFQGQGIGEAVFADIIFQAESLRVPITLEVGHGNEKAISFYKKLGFKETGKTEKQLMMEHVPKSKNIDIASR